MGLNLSAENTAALESRTEGWIAGLQLAAVALQGLGTQGTVPGKEATRFVDSFTGSHHFVLDYLVEEVLHQQPESIQTFLLQTSILDRLFGPLCDAVYSPCPTGRSEVSTGKEPSISSLQSPSPSLQGQQTLEYLDQNNLFIVALDNERRWYRYQHLFAELLRQRLQQSLAAVPGGEIPAVTGAINELHIRASQWYEDNGLPLASFHHAAAANDIDRAQRLISGGGLPLNSRDGVAPVLNWLASLPQTVLDARPKLWATWGAMLLVTGHTTGVEEKLQAAEAGLAASGALQGGERDADTRNLVGQIAAARATLALTKYDVEGIITQSRRALEYLHPENLAFRATATWNLAVAHALQGERAAAGQAFKDTLAISQAAGDTFHLILATAGLAEVQEVNNQLQQAAESYGRALELFSEQPLPNSCEVHLGLARIHYQWNDLEAAQRHGERSVELARQYENVIDRFIISEVFLARLRLARGDVAGAAAILAEADQAVRRHNWVHRMPEVAAAQVRTLLRQGNLPAAALVAKMHELPLSQARVHLARGDPSAALAMLAPWREQMEAKGWPDELLKVLVLQAVANQALTQQATGPGAPGGDPRPGTGKAVELLAEALAMAEPGGFVRTFIDEGAPMAQLLTETAARGIKPGYTARLLAALAAEAPGRDGPSPDPAPLPPGVLPLIEPLTPREQEVLQLIAAGYSNPEIAEELVIALTTVKTHVKNIYGKLQVTNRVQAVARAQELNLL
jgi:LuxR family maltose regulon positive regulatory protein